MTRPSPNLVHNPSSSYSETGRHQASKESDHVVPEKRNTVGPDQHKTLKPSWRVSTSASPSMAFLSRSIRQALTGASLTPYLGQTRFSSYTTLTSPKLFISGLNRLTTDDKLQEAFTPFGNLVEAKVIIDRMSGRSKGFGFVTYETVEEAEKAREGMNAKFLDGWVIFVDPAKPREPRPPPQPQQEPSETGFRTNKTVGWCG